MTLAEGIQAMAQIVARQLENSRDVEGAHADADSVLLAIIDSPLLTALYNQIEKWYA